MTKSLLDLPRQADEQTVNQAATKRNAALPQAGRMAIRFVRAALRESAER
jgi:hypothetical protein